MRRMMQSMVRQLEYYKFNALLILLTFLTHEQYFRVLGITVDPLDSLPTSSTPYADQYVGSSEVHDLNNIDYNQFINGPKSYAGSSEPGDTALYESGSSVFDDSNQHDYNGESFSKKQPDSFSEYVKMFAIQHSAYEMPNFFSNRIAVSARIISPPQSPAPHYVRYPFRAAVYRAPTQAPSPLDAISDGLKDRLKAIYPGTLWCGDGNSAKFKNEVGLFRNTDICCQQHDNCPAFIKSNSEFKGLRNTGLFTRSHCDCDWKFYNCLKRTNSLISNKIGFTYFNILKPQCFRKEYPIVGCRKWINKKCYAYTVDDKQPAKWQWFENRPF